VKVTAEHLRLPLPAFDTPLELYALMQQVRACERIAGGSVTNVRALRAVLGVRAH
jgi:hypothetical protein